MKATAAKTFTADLQFYIYSFELPRHVYWYKGMRNSLRNLHVALFSCFVKLFYFSVLLLFFLATFMVNKDEHILRQRRVEFSSETHITSQ